MMTKDLQGLPVDGYTPKTPEAVDAVNGMKQLEAGLLRHIALLADNKELALDKRWLAISRTQFELGFMAINRAIFKPEPVEPTPHTSTLGGWLIEDGHSDASNPRYLIEVNPIRFGYSDLEALRFASDGDAQKVADSITGINRVAYHEWGD